MNLTDPRFTTKIASSKGYKNPNHKFYLPASTQEIWCRPGHQPRRPDKGSVVAVNNYPFHPITYGGSKWPKVVFTPFYTDN